MSDVQQAVPVAGEHYRHVKRSTVYEVVGLASLQNANQAVLSEAACLVIYRGDDGNLWAREGGEFMDGRFARLTEPARKADRLGEGGQDRKFAFRDGQFVNRVSGEPIPLDEPVIIFRARDNHSLPILREYLTMASDPHHRQAIKDRMGEFAAWRADHPDRVKEPGITHHIRLNDPTHTREGEEERAAVAIAKVLGIDLQEACGSTDEGPCDSYTCPGALTEDHDTEEHRERIYRMARAALNARGGA
jgi:hypothetical protein